MVRKTRQEARRTRERILDAAVQVFSNRGVARPSLTEVAALIGMTRGAVYGHFRNKGEVLVALFEREHLPWESLVTEEGAAACTDPLGVLRRALVRLLQQTGISPTRAQTLNLLFYKVELAVENEALMQRIEVARHEAHERVLGLLRRAVDLDQLPAGRDLERDARLLRFGITGALLEWAWEPGRFDLVAEAPGIVDALLLPIVAGQAPGSPGGAASGASRAPGEVTAGAPPDPSPCPGDFRQRLAP